jgi:hypothetical protein
MVQVPRDERVVPSPAALGVRADCNRIVTRETPAHEYATTSTWSGTD